MKIRIGGLKNVRISEQKFGEILTKFCQDYTATETAKVVNVNLNTVNRYFTIFREAIYFESKKETGSFSGEVEIDESYFGARRN